MNEKKIKSKFQGMRYKDTKGGGLFEVYWYKPGTRIKQSKSFRIKDFESKEACEIAAAKYRLEMMEKRIKEPESFDAKPEVVTFRRLSILYMSDKAPPVDEEETPDEGQMTHSSWSTTHDKLKIILPIIGNIAVEDLDKSHFNALVAELKDRGNRANTIYRTIGVAKAILSWASETDKIKSDPWIKCKAPRGRDRKFIPPTLQEVEAILQDSKPHLQRAILLAFGMGVRVGVSELFRIKWDDVDLRTGYIKVKSAHKNKDMPFRFVKIAPELHVQLTLWFRADLFSKKKDEDKKQRPFDYVINYFGVPVKSVRKAWAHALDAAGIIERRIRPYDLRHAFATQALKNGAKIHAVAKVMGHADTAMVLKTYGHVIDDMEAEAIAAVPTPKIKPKDNAENVPSTKKEWVDHPPTEGVLGGQKGVFWVDENDKVQ